MDVLSLTYLHHKSCEVLELNVLISKSLKHAYTNCVSGRRKSVAAQEMNKSNKRLSNVKSLDLSKKKGKVINVYILLFIFSNQCAFLFSSEPLSHLQNSLSNNLFTVFVQFSEASRPNQKFYEMIQDYRETLEISPVSTTDLVSLYTREPCSMYEAVWAKPAHRGNTLLINLLFFTSHRLNHKRSVCVFANGL